MDKGGPKGSEVRVAGDPSWLQILLMITMKIYDKDLAFQATVAMYAIHTVYTAFGFEDNLLLI